MSSDLSALNSCSDEIVNVSILGATGSVGVSTLDVIAQHPVKFSVAALTTNSNIHLLFEQCIKFRPKLVVVAEEKSASEFISLFNNKHHMPELLTGSEGLEVAASLPEVDSVMAAIVGAAGLPSTLAAARAGKRVLLANKEALVMSGGILMDLVRENNALLLPIDSEHNAVFQCLPKYEKLVSKKTSIEKIILTASGGPFLTKSLHEFSSITPAQACKHPNWDMGKKISVDSATMMNKGLEVIEACKLFDVNVKNIEVVVHPQSIIHSIVAYIDGSMLAHLAHPDMRVPIAHALAWPNRITSGVEILDLTKISALEFSQPDNERFPCLSLAFQALQAEESATTVLNAANEVAVQNFLNTKISFTDIPDVIDAALQHIEHGKVNDLEYILDKDKQARAYANRFINQSIEIH